MNTTKATIERAKKCILRGEWESACQILDRVIEHPRIVRQRSFLFRLLGRIEEDKCLIDLATALFPNDDYLSERKRWHELPLFQKLEAREGLAHAFGKRDEANDIAILKEACFVTAADSQYFSLLVECIESIAATSFYSRLPIFVVDCGLQDVEWNAVRQRFSNVERVFPNSMGSKHRLDYSNKQLQFLTCRAQFRSLFPAHRYFFWIDADAWVQDETGLDDYINLAQAQGIALPVHPFQVNVTRHHHWIKRSTLTNPQIETVIGQKAIIASTFCVDSLSNAYEEFCRTMSNNIEELGLNWGIDQEVLLYVAAKYKLATLPTEYSFEGIPRVMVTETQSHILYSNSGNRIKIFHLGGGKKEQHRKWDYFVDAQVVDQMGQNTTVRTSIHFRVPPWSDRPQIANALREFAQRNDD